MKNNRIRWFVFWPLYYFDLIRWVIKSRRLPLPFLLKRKILLYYIKNNGLEYFVETGTCYGDMLMGIKNHVKKAVSIEIDKELFLSAVNRFENDEHIEIILGDSSTMLPSIIKGIDKPTLFYLDAHYSGPGTGKGTTDTPLLSELKLLLKMDIKKHIILIDDARHLGKKDYPKFSEIKNLVNDMTDLNIYNEKDIIRIEP